MTANALLTCLAILGVTARLDGPELVLRPASTIPPDLMAELRAHRDTLVALLTPPTGTCATCGSGVFWYWTVPPAAREQDHPQANYAGWHCLVCTPPPPPPTAQSWTWDYGSLDPDNAAFDATPGQTHNVNPAALDGLAPPLSFPPTGSRCGSLLTDGTLCGSQWWWTPVERRGMRPVDAWRRGNCRSPQAGSERTVLWTCSVGPGIPIPLRPDIAAAQDRWQGEFAGWQPRKRAATTDQKTAGGRSSA